MFPCRIGEDLELRLHRPDDAAMLYTLLEQNRAFLSRWLHLSARIQTVDDARAMIERFNGNFAAHNGFRVGMYYGDACVGELICHPINREDNKTEIGYWLAESATGKGIVTRACREIISYLFEQENIHRIEILAAANNLPSRAIAERLGFTFEGIKRETTLINGVYQDTAVYALLDREWQQGGELSDG